MKKNNSVKNLKEKSERNVIHIKLNYEDSIEGKRNILSTEKELLRIKRSMKNYRELRVKELKLKISLAKKFKELSLLIKEMNSFLPQAQLPDLLKGHLIHKKMNPLKENDYINKKILTRKYNDDIESQIKEIQNKLNSLKT